MQKKNTIFTGNWHMCLTWPLQLEILWFSSWWRWWCGSEVSILPANLKSKPHHWWRGLQVAKIWNKTLAESLFFWNSSQCLTPLASSTATVEWGLSCRPRGLMRTREEGFSHFLNLMYELFSISFKSYSFIVFSVEKFKLEHNSE